MTFTFEPIHYWNLTQISLIWLTPMSYVMHMFFIEILIQNVLIFFLGTLSCVLAFNNKLKNIKKTSRQLQKFHKKILS